MSIVLQLHAIWQWVVLGLAGLVSLKALIGWLGRRPFTTLDDRLGLALASIFDIQLLLGILLWLFGPFNVQMLPQSMSNPLLRFYLLEHNLLALVAVVLAHVGRGRAKKTTGDPARHRVSFIFFFLSFLFIALIFILRSMLR